MPVLKCVSRPIRPAFKINNKDGVIITIFLVIQINVWGINQIDRSIEAVRKNKKYLTSRVKIPKCIDKVKNN